MKKNLMILMAATSALFAACSDSDDDKKIPENPQNSGMTTFSADMKFKKSEGGMAKTFTNTQQTYMTLKNNEVIHRGTFGENSWTTFNLIKNTNYNITTSVKGWDLLFTQYIDNVGSPTQVMAYYLAGVLINPERVSVYLHEYKESEEEAAITKAFTDLKLADIGEVEFSKNINAIGYNWKSMTTGMPPTYSPKLNNFYIIKHTSGAVYKLRFTGVYGNSKDERIFKCEYSLLK